MALSLSRVSHLNRLAVRALSTTSALKDASVLADVDRSKHYPKIGNRDIVGFGINGHPSYMDRGDYPFPAIRFKENTPDVLALREKEKGDWKSLSMEDKKTLYRTSFCSTYEEMRNFNKGEWKSIVALIFFGFSVTGWMMIFMKTKVYPELPHTINDSWRDANLEMMIRQGTGPIQGIASKWDYDKNEWKK